jgi:hypothetical protein
VSVITQRALRGSKPFTAAEVNRGYRRLG